MVEHHGKSGMAAAQPSKRRELPETYTRVEGQAQIREVVEALVKFPVIEELRRLVLQEAPDTGDLGKGQKDRKSVV